MLAFDDERQMLYVASETGDIAMFKQEGRRLRKIGQAFLAKAHSVAVEPQSHRVCFPIRNNGGHPFLLVTEPI